MSDLTGLTQKELSGGTGPNGSFTAADLANLGSQGGAPGGALPDGLLNAGGNSASPEGNGPTTNNSAFVPGQTVTGNTIGNVMGNNVTNPTLPTGTQVTATPITSNANDIQKNEQLTGTDPAAAFNNQTATTAGMQPTQAAAQVTPSATAAASVAANKAVAAQGTVDPRSTVQGQYDNLTNFAPGQTPDWAKGAVTTAEQQMAARGLGASTMAGTATTAAILQAALPIAQQDAATYAAMATQNLSNEQQSVTQNTQDMVNAIFSDQAVTNAAAQFNATSTNQVDQFYKSLASNVSQFNAAQTNGMAQFNASGDQAVSQFNAQLTDLRQRFNVQNATQIDQSNVNWQRQINTANTAAVNAANATNATNLLGISNTATANLWQQALDNASFTFQASQNDLTRQANVAMAALMNNQNISNAMMTGVGNFAANLLGNFLKS